MSSRLRIDLGALAANYRLLARAARPGRCAGVVKADGYGLGAAQVARRLHADGCRDFFVASAREGAELRATLADARIFVFEGVRAEDLRLLVEARLTPVLNQPLDARRWRDAGAPSAVAVHVDTGMHRLGFLPEEVTRDALGDLEIVLLLTHLACADEPEHPLNADQLNRFAAVRQRFPAVPVSIGNSAGVLQGVARCGDLGRPGIALYGGNPFVGAVAAELAPGLRPVATLEGQILQLRRVAAGESVGYGAAYRAPDERRIAVVGLGYADGLPRLLSNRGEVWVSGRRRPILGRVSMDLTVVDVTGLDVGVGDWVEFMGAGVTVDEVAGWAETIAYEVLTGLGRRPERSYLGL
ncbi:MAG: alanine racemase [Pseudomonadales bacterium]